MKGKVLDYKPFAKNYIPGSMSFAEGFSSSWRGIGATEIMEVDEKKAKRIINSRLNKNIERAELGLDGDFIENSTTIYDSDGFHDYESWGESNWATPILIIYYEDYASEAFKCYKSKPLND